MRRKDYKPTLYPRGIAFFAEQINLTRATLSKALNASKRTRQKVESEEHVYLCEDELLKDLATVRVLPADAFKVLARPLHNS